MVWIVVYRQSLSGRFIKLETGENCARIHLKTRLTTLKHKLISLEVNLRLTCQALLMFKIVLARCTTDSIHYPNMDNIQRKPMMLQD